MNTLSTLKLAVAVVALSLVCQSCIVQRDDHPGAPRHERRHKPKKPKPPRHGKKRKPLPPGPHAEAAGFGDGGTCYAWLS